jgi:hypothetical protein
MNRASPSFIRGFFAGVFSLGAIMSTGALVMPIGDAAIRTLAAVNLPVAIVLILALYRREVRALKAGAA